MVLQRKHYCIAIIGMMLVLMSYFMLLKPEMSRLNQLYKDELSAQASVDKWREQMIKQGEVAGITSIVSRDYIDVNGRVLSALTRLAEMNGLSVESATHLNSDNRMQIRVNGHYAQISGFIHAVATQKAMLYVEDFNVSLLQTGILRAILDIILVLPETQAIVVDNSLLPAYSHDPFCQSGSQQVTTFMSQRDATHHYSVRQMKMLGSIKTAEQIFALLFLPNGAQESVSVGATIGLEKLHVDSISVVELRGRFPDKHEFVLRMEDVQ